MPEATEESTVNSTVIDIAPGDCAADSATTEKKEKVPARVPRSLSDAEYDAIFTAAIQRVMNAPIEEEKENRDDFEAVLQEKSGESKSQAVPTPTPKVTKKEAPAFKGKAAKTEPKTPKKTDVSKPKKVKERKPHDSSLKRKLTKEVTSHKDVLPTEAKVMKVTEKKKEVTKTSSKLLMVDREVEEIGIWVQCSLKSCNKWRYLKDVHDPTKLPEHWTCEMNTDLEQNNCDAKEAEFDPETEHEDFIYTKYAEGSIVWARMPGYPWWPGLVEIDPDYQIFFECREKPNVASHFHVTFLDTKVSRAWFGMKALRPFTGEETNMGPTKARGTEYRKDINEAKNRARDAMSLLLPDRIAAYGFASRFKGKWGKHVSEGAEKTKGQKQNVPDETEEGDGDFAGLSGEEVDEILDNAESSIEEAYEALNELLSQQSQELDEYLPEEPPKKKAKKEKPEKVKATEKDAESGQKSGATKKSLGIKKSATKASITPKPEKKPKATKPAKSAEEKSKPAKASKVPKPVTGSATETTKQAKVPKPAKPAKPFAPVKKAPSTHTDHQKVNTTEAEKPKESLAIKEVPLSAEQTKSDDKTVSKEPPTSGDDKIFSIEAPLSEDCKKKSEAGSKKTEMAKKMKPKFAAPKISKKPPTAETPKNDETKEKEVGSETKEELPKTIERSEPSLDESPISTEKKTDPIDDAELDFDLDIALDTEAAAQVLPEGKVSTENVESDAESADFEE